MLSSRAETVGGSALQEPRSAWEETAPMTSQVVLRCSGGSRGMVTVTVTPVMELVFEAKLLIILKIWFLIGPSLSRLAFRVVGIQMQCNGI